MGCSESKDSTKINVVSIQDKEGPLTVTELTEDITSSPTSSGMGASASAGSSSTSSSSSSSSSIDRTKVISSIDDVQESVIAYDNIPINDLGESLDASRLRRFLPRTISSQSFPGTTTLCDNQGFPTSSSSAKSEESRDSGIYDFEDDYSFVITENSPFEFVKKVERDFTPVENIDLTLTGKACPRLLSGSQKVRLQESEVLENLRQEGLISHCRQRAQGGLSFEIVEDTPEVLNSAGSGTIKPKDYLPKNHKKHLETQRNKFHLQNLTSEDIERKQFLADERRRLDMEARLEKNNISSKQEEMKLKRLNLQETMAKKDDAALEKREAHLRDLRDRLQAKNHKIKQIRLRKLINGPPVPVPVGKGYIDEGDEEFFT